MNKLETNELQYILQILNSADIKGGQSVGHANLMSKIAMLIKQENETAEAVKENAV